MVKIKASKIKPEAHFIAAMFKKIGREEGIEVRLEPVWKHVGKIIRPDGTVNYFRGANFDLNGQGAAEIAADKGYTAYFLKQAGYRIIPTKTFHSPAFAKLLKSRNTPAAAYQYAKNVVGLPVIIKPNSSSQGTFVCLVDDKRTFRRVANKICQIDRNFLVQPFISGRDYRVVVLDGKVISAYERLPLTVRGDGLSAINELLDEKQKKYQASGRDTVIDKNDFRLDLKLKRQGLKRTTVLPRGQVRALLDNCNLSTGGQAIDVTEKIHATFKKLAINIARDMALRYCGVDLMVQKDISEPFNKKTNNYWVLEVNASPGLDHYAQSGARRRRIVKEMYRRILRKLAGVK